MSATGPPRTPGTAQQKRFIAENAAILNRETQLSILAIVMMEVGSAVATEAGSGATKELDLDLDAIAAANPEVLTHIYNIVLARRATLSQPVGSATNRGPAKLGDSGASGAVGKSAAPPAAGKSAAASAGKGAAASAGKGTAPLAGKSTVPPQ
jgi:hypothetical protein